MTLRLLGIVDSVTVSQGPVHYFNTITYFSNSAAMEASPQTSFDGTDDMGSDRAVLNSLVSSGVISSQTVANSPVDQWSNVKLPQIHRDLSAKGSIGNPWIDVDSPSTDKWVSLSGIMTTGLPASGDSSFLVESSYINVTCPDLIRLPTDHLANHLHAAGLHLSINNESYPWMQLSELVNRTASSSSGYNSYFFDYLSDSTSESTTDPKPPGSLIYGSIVGNSDGEGIANYPNVEIFNCSIDFVPTENNITCSGSLCKASQVRLSEKSSNATAVLGFQQTVYDNMLLFLAQVLGQPHSSEASPLDQYMLGSNRPFSLTTPYTPNGYANITGAMISPRLTTFINTMYQASLCPYGMSLGSTVAFQNCTLAGLAPYSAQSNTTATTAITHPNSTYKANIWHASLLLLITMILQISSLISLIIAAFLRAPNILGYVSTMTRDNPYIRLPTSFSPDNHGDDDGNDSGGGQGSYSGTALDGADRTRYLADIKVQLADVRPSSNIGHIALVSVEEGNENGFRNLDSQGRKLGWGSIRRDRLYA